MSTSDSLGKQTLKGIGWSAIERFSYQGVTFVIQLVLARLLTPADYGIIAMLAIFLQIAQTFIDSGFANALIKKQDCTDTDCSTVFFYNLSASLILYAILFISAPVIADFYNAEILVPVLRVLALTLLFNAVSIVQLAKLVKNVDFKSQSKVTLTSALISGIIGIYFAWRGAGVWALVIQQILNSIVKSFMLLIVVRWIPKFVFSRESFSYVFSFGSKLLITTLIDVIYKNLYKLVIGRKFTDSDLGFYSRAEEFAIFPSNNVASIISRVSFPILSKIQDNDERLCSAYRTLIKYSSWIILPLMIGLLAVANPFVISFLTEKWEPAVRILRILCLDWMLDYLCVINLNLLLVKGRTDLILKLQIVKKIIAVTILFGSIPLGIIGMCWGRVLYSVIAVCINTYYTKRIIGLGLIAQMTDVLPYLTAAAAMGGIAFLATDIFQTEFVSLVAGVLTGIIVYTVMSLIFFRHEITFIIRHLKK